MYHSRNLTFLIGSSTIVWRIGEDLEIDRINTREADPNRVNMSASLSLLDWKPNVFDKSASSFVCNKTGACSRLKGILYGLESPVREAIIEIIQIRASYGK